ncbi:MAG: tRNA (adenosine(37)-N6)-threonylcarbamoyltransferase complex dimerization subunit type 1 TsaB [Bacteroidota bacterium]
MSYILNIDTAINSASICLSKDGVLINLSINENSKDHAAWLQSAIKNQLLSSSITIKELNAIAVSIGPGSYTGLRIGLSTAKGLCYALNIPLIAIGTLEMMAYAAKDAESDLLCPMIDARRMEVFTALYNKKMEIVLPPCAMILDERSFDDILKKHSVLYFGNGSSKYTKVVNSKNARFENISINAAHLAKISYKRFLSEDFNNIAYTEPMYIKGFHNSVDESQNNN